MDIDILTKKAHKNAMEKGFWEDRDDIEGSVYMSKKVKDELYHNVIATRLALIASEVGEAVEALRKGEGYNFNEELADIVIRVADLAGGLGIDLEQEIIDKMNINEGRDYLHGKKF